MRSAQQRPRRPDRRERGVIRKVQIEVPGNPIPQGSKRAFRAGNRIVVVDQQGEALRTYREAIAWSMRQEMERPVRGAIQLTIDFDFSRPKGHFGKNGRLPSAPRSKVSKPDIDKCIRSVMDALTGVAYVDDSQVTVVIAHKTWVDNKPATYVLVEWVE